MQLRHSLALFSVHVLHGSLHELGHGDTRAGAGQLALEPLQYTAGLQSSICPRHTYEDGLKLLDGHLELFPGHLASSSQGPVDALHTVDDDLNLVDGHAELFPVHLVSIS